ncbi:MBL fold metallo-hydrolase [Paenibacillus sp. LHD-117]|uniref:MBL fold metallo-hydrolase n=1 Tax=Paenibacillus sp. LHD-117 TaxID=3071412 RepID=UPI0027E04AA8|nr:MBL fold metallo-hydrolase [Paenibacillus sp. LHD-117]MDQ6421175.1 MBL fold metallo-hydrolase [Paenibacillus sp. LHD-117]
MRIRRFANQNQVVQQNSYKQFKRWRQERVRKLKTKDYSYQVPNVEPDVRFLRDNTELPSITWIGHSTFLIQIAGLNIITDPVWAGQMAFQKRLAPPGIPIEEVPPIDAVLISHSHYDHLNISSLRRLSGPKQMLVPAGLSTKLRLKGFSRVKELHWWESARIGGATFTFVPSQHWTRRNPWDTNSSHWGGWVIEAGGESAKPAKTSELARSNEPAMPHRSEARDYEMESGMREIAAAYAPSEDFGKNGCSVRPLVCAEPTVYFAGDSGYFAGFKEIGKRFDIDVALMPIGAYEPEWFMGPQHVTPEEALQAFEDTGAKLFVPMHYGAFKLADDTPLEALERLEAERCRRRLEEERIVVLPHGETWKLAGEEQD